jgi:hypothetical protein
MAEEEHEAPVDMEDEGGALASSPDARSPLSATTTTTTTTTTTAATTKTTDGTSSSRSRAAPSGIFAHMMTAQRKASALEKNLADAPEKERPKKPPGPIPKHHIWDPEEGVVIDPNNPPPQLPRFPKPNHRPPMGKVWDGDSGEWVDDPKRQRDSGGGGNGGTVDDGDDDNDGTGLRGAKHRSRQVCSAWYKNLPWLIVASIISSGVVPGAMSERSGGGGGGGGETDVTTTERTGGAAVQWAWRRGRGGGRRERGAASRNGRHAERGLVVAAWSFPRGASALPSGLFGRQPALTAPRAACTPRRARAAGLALRP